MPIHTPNRKRHPKDSARREPMLVAAVGISGLLLVGCGQGSDAGSVSPAATTGGSAETTSTTVLPPTGSVPATGSSREPTGSVTAEAKLVTPAGEEIGIVDFAVDGSVVTVTATFDNLKPGFKGLHIHSVGKCEIDSPDPKDPSRTGDFLSAGGHLGAGSGPHPGHPGDLSSLAVRGDGSAQLVTATDAFSMDDVLDADGSAVMVHAGPDNFANVPTRYAPSGPDEMTQGTGDSGGRAACGVVRSINP